jgi:hypothetical protein
MELSNRGQTVARGDDVLVEADVRVVLVSGG